MEHPEIRAGQRVGGEGPVFVGARVALYPMADDYVDRILGAISALSPWREWLTIETDDLGTTMIGPPEPLFGAMRDLFVAVAKTGVHVAMAATVSRGCPGEPCDSRCATPRLPVGAAPLPPVDERNAGALARVAAAPQLDVRAAAQLSLYPLGAGHHMDEIEACIAFLQASGLGFAPRHFSSTLRGDSGPLFAALAEAFLAFGAPGGHVAMDLKLSANSPSAV